MWRLSADVIMCVFIYITNIVNATSKIQSVAVIPDQSLFKLKIGFIQVAVRKTLMYSFLTDISTFFILLIQLIYVSFVTDMAICHSSHYMCRIHRQLPDFVHCWRTEEKNILC